MPGVPRLGAAGDPVPGRICLINAIRETIHIEGNVIARVRGRVAAPSRGTPGTYVGTKCDGHLRMVYTKRRL
ncbi:hypothetical protein KDAU_38700 [Dictyobacter aurantiacus]|uniref:Uncharacterized protein n=1 Tax=Dictyobacter aurantiacus TaxID=1936993 RepID=A0A401ZI69_9CHLR|nr:hypothetical protein KDAU_38700 [Dictyobacter aurantiacus]